MFKKVLATASTLFIAASLSLVGIAGTASAAPAGPVAAASTTAQSDPSPSPSASSTAPPLTYDANASAPTVVAATCSTGETLSLGYAPNATWGAISTTPGAGGTTNYSVTATANPNHAFSNGQVTKVFSGTLAGPLPASQCHVAPVCIPSTAVSYTYDAATNSGDIVVHDVANSTGQLCQSFWVTATAWSYTQNAVWPQALDTVHTQYLPKISAPGTYHYAAPVTCGQGDIYASTTGQPMPTSTLTAPGQPFAEHFLHQMGFSGPSPTYVQQSPSCNVVTPAAPTATAITECGTYGSVSVPADTAAVTYTVTGSGNVGDYVVTAKVNSPYTLKPGAQTSWTFHLGQYVACETNYHPAASYTLGECYPNGTFSSKNLYFVFDNTKSSVPVTFTVPFTTISQVVPGGQKVTVEGTPIWDQGGGYDVDADGVLLTHLTIPSFTGCLTVTPGDPTVSPEVCTDGVTTKGGITVDLQPGLQYSITGVGNSTDIPDVQAATTPLSAGTYLVSVTARSGFVLSGNANWPFTLTVLPAVNCGGLPTFADEPTNATATNATCQVDGASRGGSITLGQVDGVDFFPVVDYTINGVAATKATTPVVPGTYTITATPHPGDTLDGPSSWVLTVAAATAVCGDLKTLALTGTDSTPWLVLALVLLQLGIAVLAVRAVLARRSRTDRGA